jgi:DNA-binding MarR family transcriptional regulator
VPTTAREPGDALRAELPTGLAERPLFLVKRAQVLLTEAINGSLVTAGIDVREFTVLALLAEEGPGAQQRLSERLRVDRTSMVGLVDQLEAKRLVRRERDPGDRRAYVVTPTQRGLALVRKALGPVQAAEDRVLAALSAAELSELKRLLARVCTG